MKHLNYLLVWPLFVLGSFLYGQVLTKGNFILGSTVGFSTASSDVNQSTNGVENNDSGPSSLQISISPNVGYFLLDRLALGIGMDYTYSSLKEQSEDRTNDSDLLFGPFARYYLPIDDGMAFFFETDLGFGTSTDEQTIGDNKQRISTNIFAIGVGPGFTIYSSRAIGIEAVMKYNFARSEFDTEQGGLKTNTVTKTNQFDVSLGLQFYFSGLKPVAEPTNSNFSY